MFVIIKFDLQNKLVSVKRFSTNTKEGYCSGILYMIGRLVKKQETVSKEKIFC